MPRDDDQSLGDQNTFDGGEQDSNREPQSLGDEATFGGNAGYVDDAFDDDMEIVDLAARYTTERTLGKGGMGEVLLATDTRLNRKVAIKRILGNAARSKTAVNRFMTEAQSIAALNHPNIVQIYDYGRATDGPFLIMEFVEGSSLLDKCREGAVPLEEAIDLTCQLCDGLAKAHAANIVHRDIKPANVLLTEDGVPKLTDFGLARDETASANMTMAGAVLGTLSYMPPEQIKDAALADERSDLWSLAATLYQMVTGKSPRIIRLSRVPKLLRPVLAKALEESKDNRYQTATVLRDALQGCLKTTQVVEPDSLDLSSGECPKCHARNDVNRKFCNGCGGSLRITCLSCDCKIPAWERFCGECGGNQADLLKKQRDECYTEAASLLERGDAKAALSKIRLVKTRRLRSSDKHLKTKLTEIVKAEQMLTRLVADCKVDGVIEPSEVNEMISVVFDYVEMNPNHATIRRFQEDLIGRIKRDPRSHATLANFPKAVLKSLPSVRNSIGMELKLLPAGVFTMGDKDDEHGVMLTKPFMIGVHEVTQEQYEQVMGINPSDFRGSNNPVENVSWEDAVEFCRELSALPSEKAAGHVYRLPTEAEWEYACRAGTTTAYNFGDDDSELGDYAWIRENSGRTTHPVGGKKPNAWGLYDMHGNVWEWCQDWYKAYPRGTVTDPTGATSGSLRVTRGGCWCSAAGGVRSAERYGYVPSIRVDLYGFRVSLSLSGQ